VKILSGKGGESQLQLLKIITAFFFIFICLHAARDIHHYGYDPNIIKELLVTDGYLVLEDIHIDFFIFSVLLLFVGAILVRFSLSRHIFYAACTFFLLMNALKLMVSFSIFSSFQTELFFLVFYILFYLLLSVTLLQVFFAGRVKS